MFSSNTRRASAVSDAGEGIADDVGLDIGLHPLDANTASTQPHKNFADAIRLC